MYALGLNGGFSPKDSEMNVDVPPIFFHDSACALVEDHRVVAAVEEERLNRLKHTNKFPENALRFCLRSAGVTLERVDRIGFFFEESYVDSELGLLAADVAGDPFHRARPLLRERIGEACGVDIAGTELQFVSHHVAHATAAAVQSGFQDALVCVFDGNGERESASVFTWSGFALTKISSYPVTASLGHFYSKCITLLGFSLFDEYKVMGLAPYGNPDTFRSAFSSLYALEADGRYSMDFEVARSSLLRAGVIPRRSSEPFSAVHADFAAALQEAFETVARHVVLHWCRETGHRRLVMTGGVAQNVSLNGRLAREPLIDDMFVDPAAYDAGSAVGAAMALFPPPRGRRALPRVTVPSWGPYPSADRDAATDLSAWGPLLETKSLADPSSVAADLIAEGNVIGWVQGRAEFGARALGFRSILANPELAETRDRVNSVVKMREGFRPFAPAVPAELVDTYFDTRLPATAHAFMSFSVPVREAFIPRLLAVTHVDGSARVQTVRKEDNLLFWRLLHVLGDATDMPVVLNTSFNNAFEPIVQSTYDAVVCLLTSSLDALIVGQSLVRRATLGAEAFRLLSVGLATGVRLRREVARGGATFSLVQVRSGGRSELISPAMHDFLVAELQGSPVPLPTGTEKELMRLWQHRLVCLTPRG